jgi:hypothetical protein
VLASYERVPFLACVLETGVGSFLPVDEDFVEKVFSMVSIYSSNIYLRSLSSNASRSRRLRETHGKSSSGASARSAFAMCNESLSPS